MSALWTRLDLWARRLMPAGLCLILVLLTAVPFPVPGYAAVVPMLAMAAVFFWAIHYPSVMPPPAVFGIGLVQDVLTGALIGTGAVVLLLVYGATVTQRLVFRNKSFLVIWWCFMIVALGAAALNWALASAFNGTFLPFGAAMFQALVTFCVYPLLTLIFHGVHRLLPRED